MAIRRRRFGSVLMAATRLLVAVSDVFLLTGCPLAMRDEYAIGSPDDGQQIDDGSDSSTGGGDAPTLAPDSAPIDAPSGCVPQTCHALGAQCGSVGDGCGGMLDCGACTGNRVCGFDKPNHCTRPH
jgi:hypothetical protein